MSILDLLKVYQFDTKFRLGVNCDGGYVLGDLSGTYDLYISAGVGDEESFSRDFIAHYNMNETNSFAFDGTIDDFPYTYTNKITFIKKQIGGINNNSTTNLSFLIDKYKSIFLKMDIEAGEYPWLLSMSEEQLNNIKQIVIEIHGLWYEGQQGYPEDWNTSISKKIQCLEKLATTHYLIHVHGNNHSLQKDNISDVIELTYVNKNYFTTIPKFNKTPLPIKDIDFPNNPYAAEHILNFYPFVQL
jgi:hypothetical protein